MSKKWLLLFTFGIFISPAVYLNGMDKKNPLIPIEHAVDEDYHLHNFRCPNLVYSEAQAFDVKLSKEKAAKAQQTVVQAKIADDKYVADVKEILKKEYGLYEPTSTLQMVVVNAFKECGIDWNDVILMRFDDSSGVQYADCDGFVFQFRGCWKKLKLFPYVMKPKIIMAIRSLPAVVGKLNLLDYSRLYTIYHECGHIVNRDAELARGMLLRGPMFGITQALAVSLVHQSWVAIPAVFTMFKVLQRATERAADNFATLKLIEQKCYGPIIYTLVSDIIRYTSEKDKSENCFMNFILRDRPNDYFKSKDILKLLLANNVDIFNLMPSEGGYDVKKFSHLIKQEFPEMYAQFLKQHEDSKKKSIAVIPSATEAVPSPKYAVNGMLSVVGMGAAYIALSLWNKK